MAVLGKVEPMKQPLKCLNHNAYTIACICPMGVELAAVHAMFDEVHQTLPSSREANAYSLGRIGTHDVVVAVLPEIGNNKASAVMVQLLNDFPLIRFSLLVGIGGGIPGKHGDNDIRLGDVVVSKPNDQFGGVVQYDRGKHLESGCFHRTGYLSKQPAILAAHRAKLEAKHLIDGTQIPVLLNEMLEKHPAMRAKYVFQGFDNDILFESHYHHAESEEKTCAKCDRANLVVRVRRPDATPRIHYGTIGSANVVVKSGTMRDQLQKDLGILCVEMEAAGLVDEFPCLVIRGICDYADSHKNKDWQPYAAATAAAYAKELLLLIPSAAVAHEIEIAKNVSEAKPPYSISSEQTFLQNLKESLFYPRITMREEDIASAHKGTCDWLINDGVEDEQHEALRTSQGYKTSTPTSTDAQKSSKIFLKWLKHESGFFWITGKAGAGKSTLMKHIARHFRTHEELAVWTGPGRLINACFFFWNPGVDLQKSLLGLMRSILYQIINDSLDTLSLMLDWQFGSGNQAYHSNTVYEWTRTRLMSAFRHLFSRLPPNIFLCIFIDGLDELDGDTRHLLEFLELLSDTPRTKICVSSRHEQIFRAFFVSVPYLSLQDANSDDIRKAAQGQLLPLVESSFQDQDGIESLVRQISQNANGVFLWAELVIKEIQHGLLHGDSTEMLRSRLELIPGDIESLYSYMLGHRDDIYLQEAETYFALLLANKGLSAPMDLISLGVMDEVAQKRLNESDSKYFNSGSFRSLCKQKETRIYACCGGLIEIESSIDWHFKRLEMNDDHLKSFGRAIKFIHRSVEEFLVKREAEFFENSAWKDEAIGLLFNMKLSVAKLMPILVVSRLHDSIRLPIDDLTKLGLRLDQGSLITASNSAAQMYQTLSQIDTEFHDNGKTWYERYAASKYGEKGIYNDHQIASNCYIVRKPPFRDSLGLAAFLGFYSYLKSSLESPGFDTEQLDYLLQCVLTGLPIVLNQEHRIEAACEMVCDLLSKGADPDLIVFHDGHENLVFAMSAWASFLIVTLEMIDPHMNSMNLEERTQFEESCPAWLKAWLKSLESFVAKGADPNARWLTIDQTMFHSNSMSIVWEANFLSHLDDIEFSFPFLGAVSTIIDELIQCIKAKSTTPYRRMRLAYFRTTSSLSKMQPFDIHGINSNSGGFDPSKDDSSMPDNWAIDANDDGCDQEGLLELEFWDDRVFEGAPCESEWGRIPHVTHQDQSDLFSRWYFQGMTVDLQPNTCRHFTEELKAVSTRADRIDAGGPIIVFPLDLTTPTLDSRYTVDALNHVAFIAEDDKEKREVETLYKQTLMNRELRLGPHHPSTLHTVFKLAVLYDRQDRSEDAMNLYERGMSVLLEASQPPYTWIFRIVNNLERLYLAQCQWGKAYEMHKRTLACVNKSQDPDPRALIKFCYLLRNWIVAMASSGQSYLDRVSELVQTYLDWQQDDDDGFWADAFLGLALLCSGDEANATIAFQQRIQVTANGELTFSELTCDVCQYLITKSRFVCRECYFVDLCAECLEKHQSGYTVLECCRNHSFLKVIAGIFSAPNSKLEMFGKTRKQIWLDGLRRKYCNYHVTNYTTA